VPDPLPASPAPSRPKQYTEAEIVAHHGDPMWEAIWYAIKGWDISRTSDGVYSSPTGDAATAIYDAIKARFPQFEDGASLKVTDAMALAAMREFSAQKGESHDAMWGAVDTKDKLEMLSEWRAIIECALIHGDMREVTL
jgi:hypothetical protein